MLALAAIVAREVIDDESLPDAVEITDVPLAYRVTYDVTTSAGPDQSATSTREIMQVERPFRSLVTTVDRDGTLLTGRLSDLNRLLQFTDGRWTELQVPPTMAASDLRLDGVLEAAVAAGSATRGSDVRRVAGRACEVYRLGGPIAGGSVVAVDATPGEHTDVCVDEAGLVLLEEWRKDGELLQRRTAVDVDLDPEFTDDTFTVEDAELFAATDGGGSARRVPDDEPFGEATWELDEPPAGLELLGRWSIVRPRLQTVVDPLADPTAGRVAGIATVWADQADALVVEQGGSADGSPAFLAHPDSSPVELGELGRGELISDGRGTEVRVSFADGSFVRLWSTLPPDTVIELARALEPR